MQIDDTVPPTTKNPPEQFTGDVWLDPIAHPRDESSADVRVPKARFAPALAPPGHSHARGQTLHVTQGVVLGPVPRRTEARSPYPGQTLYCPPGAGALARRRAGLLHGAPRHDRPGRRPCHQHGLAGARQRRGVPRRRLFCHAGHHQLDRVGAATELDLASRRTDDSLSPYTTMWVARTGDRPLRALRPRTRQRLVSAGRLRHGRGRICAGGVESYVVFTHVAADDPVHSGDRRGHAREVRRYGARIVATVVGADAALVTLLLDTA